MRSCRFSVSPVAIQASATDRRCCLVPIRERFALGPVTMSELPLLPTPGEAPDGWLARVLATVGDALGGAVVRRQQTAIQNLFEDFDEHERVLKGAWPRALASGDGREQRDRAIELREKTLRSVSRQIRVGGWIGVASRLLPFVVIALAVWRLIV